ncbi:MAG: glycosyltransferase family 2 protein [Planctomycetota bacterium]|jgi:GT2 family glycosyltransferase
MELSVVIVNYNNGRVLAGCLPSLREALAGLDAEVILSDNGSRDGSVDWVRTEFPEIRILENDANLGFAEANDRALPLVHGRHVLFLNPDTVVEPDAIRALLAFLDATPQATVVGGLLLNGDGSRQISTRAFPTLWTFFCRQTGLAFRRPTSPRFAGCDYGDWDGTTARRVDWVSGAALMIRREAMAVVGGFDPGFFLTYDEVDLCRRLHRRGHEIWYTPDSRIVHLDRQSEPQSNPSPEGRLKYMTVERNSRVRYFVRHHGRVYACLVEALHLLLAAVVLVKAPLLGSNQDRTGLMEKRLLWRLYWRTLRRVPRAALTRLRRLGPGGRNVEPARVFVNPYLAG